MGVMVATGVSFTLILIQTGFLLAYPSWRLGPEGLPVKMIGLWFGPMFGFIGGVLTDMLVQVFYPISWLYILYLGMTGFAAGTYVFLRKNIISVLIINIILAIALVLSLLFVGDLNEAKIFGIRLENIWIYIGLFIAFGLVSLLSIVIWFIDKKKGTKITNILFVVILMDLIIDVPMISIANASIFASGGEDGSTLLNEIFLRIFSIPTKMLFNTIVLYTSHKYLTPVMSKKLKKGVKIWE